MEDDAKVKEKTFLTIGVLLAVAIVLLVIGYYAHDKVHFQSPIVFLPTPQHFITDNKASVVQENDAALGNPQTYSDKIMQFDKNCVAVPIVMIAKVGDSIMFENQSRYERSITVGEQMYTVLPFGRVVLSFGTINTYPVSCDSFQKVGVIGIQ